MFLLNLLVLTLVILLGVTTWWYYVYYKYRSSLKGFAFLEQVPLLGASHFVRTTVDTYYTLLLKCRSLGRNFFAMMGPFPVLFTSDPNLFSLILKSPKHVNKPAFYNFLENSAGNSLLLVNGNVWRQQRKLLNPGLDYSMVIHNIHAFNGQSDDLINTLADEIHKESTDVFSFVEKWSMLQVYETMIGSSVCIDEKLKYMDAAKRIMKICIERIMRPSEYFKLTYVFTPNYWLEKKLLKILFPHILKVIKMKKLEMEEGHVQRNRPILIDILLKQMQTDDSITDIFIAKQLNLMITAGYDTTATAVSFALYNMSIFPDIQQKAYEEVFSILGREPTQQITHEHIKKMIYLDLVIKESMRLKSTVPMFIRQLDEDVDFDGTRLRNGLVIIFLAYAMHLDPALYPDPEQFIPERFAPENLNKNRYSYVPFCEGVRNCIGQKYAMLAIKVVLAKILMNYKLVDVKHELLLATEVTLVSKTGVEVGFRKRDISQKKEIRVRDTEKV